MRPVLHAHTPDPLQLPELRLEQPAQDEAEAVRLQQLAELVATAGPLADLRTLAPAVRALLPAPTYEVGCGGTHIWVHRTAEARRLAVILDQLSQALLPQPIYLRP